MTPHGINGRYGCGCCLSENEHFFSLQVRVTCAGRLKGPQPPPRLPLTGFAWCLPAERSPAVASRNPKLSLMGMVIGCLGNCPHRVPGAWPLTCFITRFTLVSFSFTTRFSPRAPGFSSLKIYQRQGKKLSGNAHSFALPKVRPAPKPPALLLVSLQAQ